MQTLDSSSELNILFVGNSLTYFYDMPQTLQSMLSETHPKVKVDQITFPGQSLFGHLNGMVTSQSEHSMSTRQKRKGEVTETEKKLKEKKWDIIILQNGTVRVLIPECREYKMNPAIKSMITLVDNPETEFVLFKTWPSLNPYPKQYCYPCSSIDKTLEKDDCCSPKMENLEQEIQLINTSYNLVSEKFGMTLSENGQKFYEVLSKHTEVNIFDDKIHPNAEGAFFNACVFYHLITKQKSSDLKYTGDLNPKTARLLKIIADED